MWGVDHANQCVRDFAEIIGAMGSGTTAGRGAAGAEWRCTAAAALMPLSIIVLKRSRRDDDGTAGAEQIERARGEIRLFALRPRARPPVEIAKRSYREGGCGKREGPFAIEST